MTMLFIITHPSTCSYWKKDDKGGLFRQSVSTQDKGRQLALRCKLMRFQWCDRQRIASASEHDAREKRWDETTLPRWMTKVNDQHVYVAMPVAEAGNNPFNFSLASVMLAVLSDGRNIIVDKEKCPSATYLCAKIHKYFLLAKNIACFLTEGKVKSKDRGGAETLFRLAGSQELHIRPRSTPAFLI